MASKRQQAREARKSSRAKMGTASSKEAEKAAEAVADDMSEDEMPQEFEVKAIRDYNAEEETYRVRWKGYKASDDTWEPVVNLANAGIKIHRYWVAQHRQAGADKQRSDGSDSEGAAGAAPTAAAAAGRTPKASGGVKKPKSSTQKPSRTPSKGT